MEINWHNTGVSTELKDLTQEGLDMLHRAVQAYFELRTSMQDKLEQVHYIATGTTRQPVDYTYGTKQEIK